MHSKKNFQTLLKQSVCHITSVHPRYDSRIFLKQARSLASNGYKVSIVVSDGIGNEVKDGISIFDVGSSNNRFKRIFKATSKIYNQAKIIDADIYHLHDPELIPIGLRLKRFGKIVIFDAHEDSPEQLLTKPYLNKPTRILLSRLHSLFELLSCRHFDAIIASTPFITNKFHNINKNSININNYCILDEFEFGSFQIRDKSLYVCYIGNISDSRGIFEMINALQFVTNKVRLLLAGKFNDVSVKSRVKAKKGWAHVDELGWLNRKEVAIVLKQSFAGLLLLHPFTNYIYSKPIKLFEYMASGIPVIASNFQLWKSIIEGNDCGICLNPLEPRAIAHAIDFLFNNPDRAEMMGNNGRIAVTRFYNWSNEEQKLLRLYHDLLKT